ncbi:MAG: DUF721 domain-containing protein [Chitinophagales bacterium]|nr:DUF721 domain-containing protein [Chitinophagales bacterium]
MRKTNEQPIGEAIKELFKQFHLEDKVHEVQVKELWNKVMGKTISHYTYDIRLKSGTLIVYLNSAPLKQDLSFNKGKIAERLNEEFGEIVIKEVIIR